MNEPMTVSATLAEDRFADIEQRFRTMQRASRSDPPPGEAQRKAHLRALARMIASSRQEFIDAIARDFGWRSHDETLMAEVVPSLTLIADISSNLRAWMRPERRDRWIAFWPGRNRVYWQPKGVVLIISPWNYPLQLTVGPLAAALAAGNRVIIKPSETTPLTASALKRNLEAAFGPDRVMVATGGAELAAALCRLPFDHILFTGSTAVGRKVMQAAAETLTPVTLELGGKSPAIVHEGFDLATAATRIARGKLLNAGQTCIAPDYVMLPVAQVETFVALLQQTVARLYPRLIDNPDYTAVINEQHYQRLASLVADAHAKGARILTIDPAGELAGGQIGSPGTRKMLPIVLTGVRDDMAVMQEEIFGPVLPIVGYERLHEAVAAVNARPRPLALYYFDADRARAEQVLASTVSGGATINDTIYHFAQDSLPFGGIGQSGMGAYHGREGFRTFSHAKGVFWQSKLTLASLLAPPYGPAFRRLIQTAIHEGLRRIGAGR